MSAHPEQALAHAIRFLSIDAIVQAQEGHQGVPLGMAEIATALYTRHLKFAPQDAGWFDRDRVVLSNGHGSMLLYALLHLTGYPAFPIEELQRFRVLGSVCEGHPERPHGPANGIEVTTGPLVQGIANALGMAVAEAYLNARFGSALVDHFIYAFVGDGCLQEGIGQEMISLAGHLRLGKLVLLWDDNQITDDGSTHLSISENVAERFRVAGWHVIELDGHDIEAAGRRLATAHEKVPGRPLDAAALDPTHAGCCTALAALTAVTHLDEHHRAVGRAHDQIDLAPAPAWGSIIAHDQVQAMLTQMSQGLAFSQLAHRPGGDR